jgi:hypothetical protein
MFYFPKFFIVLPQKGQIPESITTIDDAKLIICIVENERRHCEEDLRSALANAEEACCWVHDAEDQMEQADMRVGKARYIIKKSGFGIVLRPTGRKTQPLVLGIRSAFVISSCGLPHSTSPCR